MYNPNSSTSYKPSLTDAPKVSTEVYQPYTTPYTGIGCVVSGKKPMAATGFKVHEEYYNKGGPTATLAPNNDKPSVAPAAAQDQAMNTAPPPPQNMAAAATIRWADQELAKPSVAIQAETQTYTRGSAGAFVGHTLEPIREEAVYSATASGDDVEDDGFLVLSRPQPEGEGSGEDEYVFVV